VRAAVDQLLADKKIEANDIAGRITMNLRTMRPTATTTSSSPDLKQIVAKQPEDFQALVQSRVLAHQQEEQRREEATRERIRQEEERKAREKVAASSASSRSAKQRRQRAPSPARRPPPRSRAWPPHAPASNTPLPRITPITRPRGKPTAPGRNQRAPGAAFHQRSGAGQAGVPGSRQGPLRVLFHEADFEAMCDSIVAHVRTAAAAPARSGGRMKTALVFDTETTGLPLFEQPSDHPDQPHLVQLGALLVDLDTRRELASVDLIVRPDGWVIGEEVSKIHGITHELAMDVGVPEASWRRCAYFDVAPGRWRLPPGWHTTSPSMHASCASPSSATSTRAVGATSKAWK
jgi:hypothetical protein